MTSSSAPKTTPKGRSPRSRTADGIDANPLALVAGGVALGVVIGALLPRPAREKEMLAPVGKRIAEGASAAAAAAREAGKAELDAILPARDDARDQIGKIIGSALTAAKQAAAKADA